MKKIIIIAILLLAGSYSNAQQIPTGASSSSKDWYRGGNVAAPPGLGGTNNIFGTFWNSPIHTVTDGTQRMIINGSKTNTISGFTVNTAGYVGIGRFGGNSSIDENNGGPWTLLHLEGPNNSGAGSVGLGFRPWMKTGMLTKENSDAMYVGMWEQTAQGINRSDAVINWSDDDTPPFGPDQLRFVVTGTSFAAGLKGSVNGMEMARFSPNGNAGFGNFSITAGINDSPVRRVEILDVDPNTGTNANAPQLRLTYLYNANPVNGIFSEFQTTSAGDLYFNTRSNANARRFGFHDATPGNTVEITSQLGVPYFGSGNGSSGLRFTNLTSAATPVANGFNGVNSSKVLTVDQNGDVVLTNAVGANTVSTAEGITFNPVAGTVELGAPCPAIAPNVPVPIFTSDRIIAPGNFNLNFITGATQSGSFGFGNTFGICNPGNTVEIGANAGSLYSASGGSSGLRFTWLNSSHPIIPNGTNGVNSSKVLTVDQNGDVVLTQAVSSLGHYCSAPQQVLTGNYGIPLNSFNFSFYGTKGNVYMGDVPCGIPGGNSRLLVRNTMGLSGAFTAIRGEVSAFNNVAIWGNAVFASGANASWAGYFNGRVFVSAPQITFSDGILKGGFGTINNAVSIVESLKPYEFYYDTLNSYGFNFTSKKQFGFKAGDVKQVLPSIVDKVHKEAEYDDNGNLISQSGDFEGLSYSNLIAILTRAIQEQQLQIKSQDSIINVVQQQISSCCSSSISNSSNQNENLEKLPTYNVNIGNDDLPMLAQNIPNPYGNSTNIQFNIPKNAQVAQIVFFNEQGMILNSVEINTKGRGQINLNAEKLENGLYFYSLIIDGKKVDTKKMVKAE